MKGADTEKRSIVVDHRTHHASARSGTQLAANVLDLDLVHLSRPMQAPEAAAVTARAETLTLMATCHHWARRYQDGWHIGRDGPHQQGRRRLVAATDQHHGIHWLALDHFLGINRHLVAQEHACWESEGFMEGDDREFNANAACESHPTLHRLDNIRHIPVTGIIARKSVLR